MSEQAFEEKAAELRALHGLDQSLVTQYMDWMGNLLKLNLGTSIHTGGEVRDELAARLPATVLLAICALGIQVILGLLLGKYSARKAGTPYDGWIRFICVAAASTPAFVLSLFLLSLFAVKLRVYEISSEASLSRLWLPAVTLGILGAPQLVRTIRASMLAELGQTYVSSAVARGLGRRLVMRHASMNIRLPLLTVAGLSFASLVTGAVVIESIFSWPGVGKYALDSILMKDYPVIQGYALIMVSVVILINAAVEVGYTLLDPRIRRQGKAGWESNASSYEVS